MRSYISYDELEELGETIVRAYINKTRRYNALCVDIEGLVTDYLGLTVVYETIVEDDLNKIAFLSNGKRPLRVVRDGKRVEVIFPKNTVVLDKVLLNEKESSRRRFTLGHEGAHSIIAKQNPMQDVGCISRLDYGKKYCTESITVDEQALQRAIVRALNRFNVEDEATYLLLMKSTIGEAVGINGSSDEIDLLERRIDALNKRMLDLVSLSVQEGDDAENHEDDFKNISTQIEQLTKRITAIRESESENGDFQARLKEIQDIIDKRRENKDIYDDSIVRQMVECIKVYHDGRLQIILGGGYELEEYLEK